LAALGPSNDSEHRRAAIRAGDDETVHIAPRYAIDWLKLDASGNYSRGTAKRNGNWYGYGMPVYAGLRGKVIQVNNDVPDNQPGERAVKMTIDTVLGNFVLIELSAGIYACYVHLQPGSVTVVPGTMTEPETQIGKIGNSGNSDGPHLHFQLVEAASAQYACLRGEGLPFAIEKYFVTNHDPDRVRRKALLSSVGQHEWEMPADGDVVAFPSNQQE
jgi:hypothetical protein